MYIHNMCLHMYSGWNCFQNCLCANIAIFTDVHVHIVWQSSCVCVCVCVGGWVGVSKNLGSSCYAALNSDTQGSQDLLCSLEKVVSSRLAGLLLSCETAKAGKFW